MRCQEQKHASGPVQFVADGFCLIRDRRKGKRLVVDLSASKSCTADNVKNGTIRIPRISKPFIWLENSTACGPHLIGRRNNACLMLSTVAFTLGFPGRLSWKKSDGST
jgi:hypothetical protein